MRCAMGRAGVFSGLVSLVLMVGEVTANPAPRDLTLEELGCETRLDRSSKGLASQVYRKLRDELPGVASLSRDFILSKEFPLPLALLFEQGLLKSDTQVYWLSEEVEALFGFPLGALHMENADASKGWRLIVDPQKQSLNQEGGSQANVSFVGLDSRHTLLIPENGLPHIVHELAHVLFSEWLDTHAVSLFGKFPKSLVQKTRSGRILIHEQIYNLLNERFAHELEFLAIRRAYKQGLIDWPEGWSTPAILDRAPHVMREALGKWVADTYKISHPEALSFVATPLETLLVGLLDTQAAFDP